MGTVSITIVYEDLEGEVTCYRLEDENMKKAGLFLNMADKGDFSGWEKICSSYSEKTAETI